jgi:hypothetical protein
MAAQAVLPPDTQGIVRVFILHLAGQDTHATAVPSSTAFLLSVTAWSADSSWLLYQGPGEHMWAYQVTTRQVRSSDHPHGLEALKLIGRNRACRHRPRVHIPRDAIYSHSSGQPPTTMPVTYGFGGCCRVDDRSRQ